jgi:mono/diheme cytochrome c family protein
VNSLQIRSALTLVDRPFTTCLISLAIVLGCTWVVLEAPTDAAVKNVTVPVERGKSIYEERCGVCHGPQGKGDGPEAPFLSPRPGSLVSAGTSVKSDTDLLAIIDNGKPRTAMPGWKDKLTEEQRQDVLAYIRTLIRFQKSLTPPPAPPVGE